MTVVQLGATQVQLLDPGQEDYQAQLIVVDHEDVVKLELRDERGGVGLHKQPGEHSEGVLNMSNNEEAKADNLFIRRKVVFTPSMCLPYCDRRLITINV